MNPYFSRAAFLITLIGGTGSAQAQVLIEHDIAGRPVAIERLETEVVRQPDGTVITRKTYREPDGSIVTRETYQTAPAPAPAVIALTPLQRRTIYRTVSRAVAAPVVREELIEGSGERLVRRRSWNGPAAMEYGVGARLPETVEVMPFPEPIIREVPTVRPYRYALVDGRVLLVDPETHVVVSEIAE
jgi:hypothetical protein